MYAQGGVSKPKLTCQVPHFSKQHTELELPKARKPERLTANRLNTKWYLGIIGMGDGGNETHTSTQLHTRKFLLAEGLGI